jgi:hypothetical protein
LDPVYSRLVSDPAQREPDPKQSFRKPTIIRIIIKIPTYRVGRVEPHDPCGSERTFLDDELEHLLGLLVEPLGLPSHRAVLPY